MQNFPYGIREFEKIISGGYVYIDRTDRLHMVEEWGYEVLFLRPRRFGKSLWLSTMMDYYDIAKTDDFGRLFGHLAIGKEPTPLHNQYMVMRWDFSKIRSHGTVEQIEDDLNARVNGFVKRFILKYDSLLSRPIEIDSDHALNTVESLLAAIDVSGHKLYLFIDEYDNFANEVMMSVNYGQHSHQPSAQQLYSQEEQNNRYEQLVSGEGLFKTLFKNLKGFGSGEGLDRIFVTGVSPVVMNDVSSGANVFEDIYWFKELNDLCGFWENEVANMLAGVIQEKGYTGTEAASKQREALNMMRTYYDGSWFTTEVEPPDLSLAEQDPKFSTQKESYPSRLYNPTMVFYFLRYLQRTGQYPEQMLDRNLQADKGKLTYIGHYGIGRELLVESLNSETTISVPILGTDFGAKEMLRSDMAHGRLASLLCYLGGLTIDGKAENGQVALTIPNLVMRELYAERILQMSFTNMRTLRDAELAADELFVHGDIQPLCNFIEANIMSIYSNRDYPEFKELALKSIFIALLYHHPLYTIYSEPELQRRYGDLVMLLRPTGRDIGLYNLLFEFKQLPLKKIIDMPASSDAVTDSKGNDKNTARKSALSGEEVKAKSRVELLAIPAVLKELETARTQLRHYQKALYDQHGNDLKLRAFAVVGVGLERIIFEEI